MNTSICSRSSINSTPLPILNDPGYSVYLIYQKEVYNCDHAFLQSLMDWIYTSSDSPYKFIFRNRAFININHYGIILTKDKNVLNNQQSSSSITSTTDNSSEINAISNPASWTNVHFNLKHLKEIYVDKRHKDTCVLVSKVSAASANNIYVWKKTNPSNYQTFRSPYALNNAYKKSYLLTIIKFKDGPTRLLQSIQLLDSILADYNRQNSLSSKKHNSTSDINNLNTISNKHKSKLSISDLEKIYDSGRCQIANKQVGSNANNIKLFNSIGHGATKTNNRFKPSIQQYFNDYLTRKLLNGNGSGSSASCISQSQHQQQQNQMNYSSTSSTNIINNLGHCSLKNNHSNSINSIVIRQPRRLSVDNSSIFLNNNTKLNNPLYSSSVNNSNISLQSYCNSCNLPNRTSASIQPSSYSLSRHSSINEITSSINFYQPQPQHYQQFHHYHHLPPPQQLPPQPFINRSCNIVKTNSINSSIGLNINRSQLTVNNINNKVSSSVPASPAPRTTSASGKFINVNNSQVSARNNAPTPCQNCHHLNCYYSSNNNNNNNNNNINNNNTSKENLSEINCQQFNRKYINLNNDNNNNYNKPQLNNLQPRYSVSSTSSLNQTAADSNKPVQNSSLMLLQKTKVANNKIYQSSNVAYPQVQLVNLALPQQATSLLANSLDLSQNNANNNNVIAKPTVKRHSSITSITKPTHLINQDFQNQLASNILIEVKNNLNKVNKNELDKVIEKTHINSSSATPTLEKSICTKMISNKNSIFTKNEDSKKANNVNNNNDSTSKNSNCDKKNKNSCKNDLNESQDNSSQSSNLSTSKESNNKVRDIINTFNNFNSNLNNPSRTSAFTSTLPSSTNNSSLTTNEEYSNEKITSKSTPTAIIPKNIKTTIEESVQNLNPTTSPINNNVKNVCQTMTQLISNVESPAASTTTKSVKNCINSWNNSSQLIEKDESNEQQNKTKNESVVKPVSKINKIAEKLSHEMNKNMNLVEPQNKIVNLKSRNSINLGNLNSEENNKLCSNKTNLLRGASSNSNISKNQIESNNNKDEDKKEANAPTKKVVETIIQNLKSTSTSFDYSNNTKSTTSSKISSKNKNGEKSTSTRKRTFANMNWPIDPEEEKILRSSSPYVVPEVIVQRNERVKSILKKNNFTSLNDITNPNNEAVGFNETNAKYNNDNNNNINSSSITIPTNNSTSLANNLINSTNNMASPFSSKKRVDFRENFCMVNFFETHKNEHDSNNRYVRNITGKAVSILNKNDFESTVVEQETTKASQAEVEVEFNRKVISNN